MRKYLLSTFCVTSMALAPVQLAAQANEAVVELSNVTERSSAAVMTLPGTIIGTRDAQIAAELPGRLEWIADVGDRVEAGEPVARIDDHLLQLDLRNDEARIARINADIDYNERQRVRLQRLAETNNMAQSEMDEVESRIAMLRQDRRIAEVDRDRTRYDLQRSKVPAPFSGVIASRDMSEGEYTAAGSVLLRLVDDQRLEVSVNAPLAIARYNREGNSVHVAAETQQLLAPIRALVPVGDDQSRMMELRLALDAGQWFIGEAVTVELPLGPPTVAMSVPRDALVLRGEQVYVYTVDEGNQARKIPVSVGAGHGRDITIETDQLSVGDPVIVRGAERLRQGQPLKVILHHLAIAPQR